LSRHPPFGPHSRTTPKCPETWYLGPMKARPREGPAWRAEDAMARKVPDSRPKTRVFDNSTHPAVLFLLSEKGRLKFLYPQRLRTQRPPCHRPFEEKARHYKHSGECPHPVRGNDTRPHPCRDTPATEGRTNALRSLLKTEQERGPDICAWPMRFRLFILWAAKRSGCWMRCCSRCRDNGD
jgi:hypothetical protein